jgi:hypothetical protein
VGIRCADHATLTSPTSGGHSVGIVRLRTKCHGVLRESYQQAVKWVESVSDRMSYLILRGRWCDNIILNDHAPAEGNIYDLTEQVL